jgi:NAD(P)-dependent dehydrogenase (short-subunit alcohol dehydrogenase family)
MTAPTFAIPDPIPFDQLLSLRGRCAIVTGGSRGIGEAVVMRLAEAGVSVVVTARRQEGLTKVEAKVGAQGLDALTPDQDYQDLQLCRATTTPHAGKS